MFGKVIIHENPFPLIKIMDQKFLDKESGV